MYNLFSTKTIFINHECYAVDDLYSISLEKIKNQEDELFDFWSFVRDWTDPQKESIEVHTSGSTGKPKVIIHLKSKMLASAQMTCDFFNLNQDKTALICLSPSHIGGKMMIVRSLLVGMKIIVTIPTMNPIQDLEADIDFTAMVPAQVQDSIANSPKKWSKINTVIVGGGAVSFSLENLIKESEINAFHTFGMTETTSHIALRKIGEAKCFTALKNISFTQDERGCLVIDAPNLLKASLQTNDVVNLKNEHQFEWLGRADNAIETGGLKVLPELLEQKISQLVTDRFFVASRPSKKWNNEIILIVESSGGYNCVEDLKRILRKHEVPKEVFFLPKFVETSTGKIQRKKTLMLLGNL